VLKQQAQLEAEIAEIIDNEPAEPRQVTGVVPASWLSKRQMATIRIPGARFAHVGHSQWISYLRRELESRFADILPNKQFDLSDVMSRDRRVSQTVATMVNSLEIAQGIFYQSRHGSDLNNWAIFESAKLEIIDEQILLADDSDFREALAILNLGFDPAS
jgi:hypothetical protein